jgi:hypothetical protein
MNVKELIEQLKSFPDDMEVMFAYNYGDYWKTEVAASIGGVNAGQVTYSAYHQMDKLVDEDQRDEDDEEDEEDNKNRTVCLLIC